jgi:hypothetical protein
MGHNKTKQLAFLEAYPLIHGPYYYYDIIFILLRKKNHSI